jgi:hypothetical protein
VRALLDWPAVEADDTYSATALASGGRYLAGTFVARVGPGRAEASELRNWRGADLTAPLAEQLAAVRMYWQVAPGTRLVLRHRVDRDGFVPFVATVSGFVAVTANIAGLAVDHERGVVLDLDRPGAWSERFRGHRLITRRGGPWTPWTGH